jgi:hypothetical protein
LGTSFRPYNTGEGTIGTSSKKWDHGYFDNITVGSLTASSVLQMPSYSSDPSSTSARIYYNTTTKRVKVCQNGAWVNVWTD